MRHSKRFLAVIVLAIFVAGTLLARYPDKTVDAGGFFNWFSKNSEEDNEIDDDSLESNSMPYNSVISYSGIGTAQNGGKALPTGKTPKGGTTLVFTDDTDPGIYASNNYNEYTGFAIKVNDKTKCKRHFYFIIYNWCSKLYWIKYNKKGKLKTNITIHNEKDTVQREL